MCPDDSKGTKLARHVPTLWHETWSVSKMFTVLSATNILSQSGHYCIEIIHPCFSLETVDLASTITHHLHGALLAYQNNLLSVILNRLIF